jgi:hypothetical protein
VACGFGLRRFSIRRNDEILKSSVNKKVGAAFDLKRRTVLIN